MKKNLFRRMITTTELCTQIGYKLPIAKIKALGFSPLAETKTVAYWSRREVHAICLSMAQDLIQTSLKIQNDEIKRNAA